ncbi:MAG TPA: major capsid protein [Vineibacter sp.]|nr:major capsid protein [Vineibacter sp.]
MLDVFSGNGFSVLTLTDAVNKLPYVPGRLGQLGIFAESGIATTTIEIEERNGVLRLVAATPRGAPGVQAVEPKRKVRKLAIPHIELDDTLNADQVQNVRAFGTNDQLLGVQQAVNTKMGDMVPSIDATLEFHRIGAVKGIVMDADGVTPLYNLFSEFGVTQETEIDFDLDNAAPASGAVRLKCTAVVRLVTDNLLGGTSFQRIHAVCGDTFWDQLIAHKEVRETYLNQQEAAQLRNGVAYETLNYGGITFENYRGKVRIATGADADVDFVGATKAHFFPVGAPGLFKHYNAPADLIETVNTIGLPRYARMYPDQNGKLVHIEVQANPIMICTQPKTLIVARNT